MSFLIPGLGQLIKGQILKGIVFMICSVISAFMVFVLIGFITTPILWIWSIYDAYNN